MIILVDLGNTNTKFAVSDRTGIRFSFSISTQYTRSPDEYLVLLSFFCDKNGIYISDLQHVIFMSIAPPANCNLLECFASLNIPVKVVAESDFSGIDVQLRSKYAGVDRLAELIAARSLVKTGSLLVVGMGTATTFNLLSSDNAFYGQIIAPGLRAMGCALHDSTCLLPNVSFHAKAKLVSDSTIGAVESGVYWGYVSMVEGIIKRLYAESTEEFKVIMSISKSKILDESLLSLGMVVHDLALNGMLEIVKKNQFFE